MVLKNPVELFRPEIQSCNGEGQYGEIWGIRGAFEKICLTFILIIGGCLRFSHITIGLPDLYGYDEIFEVHRALELLRGEYDFLRTKGVYYQILSMVYGVHAGILMLFGQVESISVYVSRNLVDPSNAVLLSRVISASLGVLSVYQIYILGKWVFPGSFPGARIMLAAVWASCWLPVWLSKWGLIETLVVNLGICGFIYIIKILQDQSWRNYVLAGVFIGVVTATKMYGILLVLPLLLAHCLADVKLEFAKLWNNRLNNRLLGSFIGVGVALVVFSPSIIWNYMNHGIGQGVIPWQPQSDQIPWRPWEFYMKVILQNLGYFMVPFFLLGLLTSISRWHRETMICGAFALLYLMVFGLRQESEMIYARYMLLSLPFFWIITLFGIQNICEKAGNIETFTSLNRLGRLRIWGAIIFVVAISVIGNNIEVLAAKKPMVFQNSFKPVRQVAVQWFRKHVPEGTKVLMRGGRRPWPGNQTIPLFDLKSNYLNKFKMWQNSDASRGSIALNFLPDLAKGESIRRYNLVTIDRNSVWEALDTYIDRGVEYVVMDPTYFSQESDAMSQTQQSRVRFYRSVKNSPRMEMVKQYHGKNLQGNNELLEIFKVTMGVSLP